MNIDVSERDLHIIYQGLGELPLKLSGEVFGKLQGQVQAQASSSPARVESASEIATSGQEPPLE